MTGTRTAPVITDCARCIHNPPLLVGVIYCEAKIALSNSLAVIAVFLLAYERGFCEAFMSRSLSLFCPLNLNCYAYLIYFTYCITSVSVLCCCTADLLSISLRLYCTATAYTILFRKVSKR
jgi:hypothetical protein